MADKKTKKSPKKELQPADFIHPLNMNGLSGRMLRMPAPTGKKREILFIYGQHSSIERWWGVIQDLNQYGGVTVPDLPGYGGMTSFYKIGEKPTLDNMADYLASFIKLRYKRGKVTIVGLSYGFVVATRMLQRYPDLVKRVDFIVSVVGFTHRDDFAFSKPRYWFFRAGSAFFKQRLPAFFYKNTWLNPLVIRLVYSHTASARARFEATPRGERKELIDYEIYLWHANDLRTWQFCGNEYLKLDNCRQQINLPVWHINIDSDQYFNHDVVEQHLQVIFSDFHSATAHLSAHAPSVVSDVKTAAPLIPKAIRRQLAKQP